MKLDPDYDKTRAASDGAFQKPIPNTYICRIMRAKATKSKAGNPMLVLDLDIAEGLYEGYYARLNDYYASKNWEPKWPRFYQLTTGNSLPYFKQLLQTVEKSNAEYKVSANINNGEFNEKSLENNLIGAVFVGEEFKLDGRIKLRLRPAQIVNVEDARNGKVPEAWVIDANGFKINFDPDKYVTHNRERAESEDHELERVEDVDIPF